MAKERFARTVYDVSGIGGWDAFALTVNIAMLAIVYTILGSFMSFIFYYLFDEYDLWHEKGLDWEKKSLTYQVADLLIEVALIAVVSFWSTFFVNERFPIIPVQFVISRIFGPTFDKYLPDSGSIVDLSLHWSKPGEEKRDTGNTQKMSNKPRKNGEGRTPAST